MQTHFSASLSYSDGGKEAWDVLAFTGRISNERTVQAFTCLSLDEGKIPCYGETITVGDN